MKFHHILASRGRWGYWPAGPDAQLAPTPGATMKQMRAFGQAMDAADGDPAPGSAADVRRSILGPGSIPLPIWGEED